MNLAKEKKADYCYKIIMIGDISKKILLSH